MGVTTQIIDTDVDVTQPPGLWTSRISTRRY